MKWQLFLLLVMSTLAFAQNRTAENVRYSQECNNNYRSNGKSYSVSCGSESITGRDDRQPFPITQPVGPSDLKAACGGSISSDTSYKANINPLLCGEGAMTHDRIQTPLSKQVMSQWSIASRSGTPDAQKRMQAIRNIELKYDGEIEFPVFESWTYEAIEGGYNTACGMERWDTTCEMSRSVEVSEKVEVEDRTNCLEYEEIPDPPPVSSSSGYSNSSYDNSSSKPKDSYRPDNSPVDRSLPGKPKGNGESKEEGRKKSRGYYDEGNVREITFDRSPASRGRCLRYGKKTETRTSTEQMSSVRYNCVKQRAKWCTWPVTKSVTRRCNNQKAKYTVKYEHDPKWVPGYVDAKSRFRDYQQILPNKFELLVGETENFTVFNNYGESYGMKPAFKIESKWNEYDYKITPQSLKCEFQKEVKFDVSINTIGRNLVRAPNPLALPNGETIKVDNGKPTRLYLLDLGRSTQVKAAELSRQFEKPENSLKAKREVVHVKAKMKTNEVSGLVGDAYWQETQYRFQLYEKGRWGRTSMLTVPTTFGSNQGIFMRDRMEISLVGEDAIKDSYRAAGPAHKILGWLWERTGAEFTPGQKYFFKVQALPRGLPFYESGCTNGQVTCEGQEGKESAYSEPVTIEWTAPADIDNRSLFKKFKDFQKMFQIL